MATDGIGLGLSGEMGWPLAVSAGFELEPQLQLVGQHIDFARTNDGLTDIDLGDTDNLSGRFGLIGRWQIRNSEGQLWLPYVRLNFWRDWKGAAVTYFEDDQVPLGQTASRLEVAAGASAALGRGWLLYGQGGYQWNIGGEERRAISATLGVRCSW